MSEPIKTEETPTTETEESSIPPKEPTPSDTPAKEEKLELNCTKNGKVTPPSPSISNAHTASYFSKAHNDFEALGIKTKNSIPENFETVDTDELHPKYDDDLNGLQSIPIFYPTEEEFQDPMSFIEKIRPENEIFGAVKIIPPKAWNPPFALDISRLKFRAAKQSLNHSTSNFNEKVQFYKDLLAFHKTKKLPLIRLPSIDRRVLDLFKLRESVHLKGGFDLVCRKKLWAQIGRELGYTGRIMTSLSSSLKNSYQKVVHSYDLYLEGKDVEISEIPNESNKRPLKEQSKESISTVTNADTSDGPIENDPKRRKTEPSAPEDSSVDIVPTISNSNRVFKRSRDILKSKGFKTNYESYTEEKQGITQTDDYTFPYYDFNFWHKGVEVLDYPFPSTEMSQLYSLDDYFEVHLRYQSGLLPSNEFVSDDELINEYWRLVHEKSPKLNVESASNLSSSIYGSGFPTMTEISQHDPEYITSPWNLNNLPLHEKGLMRYLVNENESISKPELDIGMLYSTQSWAAEDHLLYSADYQHFGASKVHYFIPPECKNAFEHMVSIYAENQQSDQNSKVIFDDFPEPIASDVLETIKIQNQFGERADSTNPSFRKLYEKTSKKLQHNTDGFIPLSLLEKYNVGVRYTIQKPGQFVVKFPKTYSSSVSLGFNLNEHVNFAPFSWLDHALDGEKWLQEQGLLPCFSFFQLLTTIAEDSKDSSLLKRVVPLYNELIESQFELRSQLKSTISNMKTIINKFDYISDDNLSICFPTKIVVWQGKDAFNLQPENFIELYKEGKFEDEDYRFEMHVYCTDDRLKTFQRTLTAYAQTPKDWVIKFEELLKSNPTPPLRLLKTLLSESERIKDHIPEAEVLRAYLDDTSGWIEKVQEVLSAKQKNRIRNRRGSMKEEMDSSNFKPELIQELADEACDLTFSCPEIDQLAEFTKEIYQYEITVRSFLTEGGNTMDDFYHMIDLGKSFGVELKSIKFLQRIVDRLEWITRANNVLDKSNSLGEYRLTLNEGYEIGTKKDQELIDKLTLNYNNGKYLNAKFKHFLALPSLSIGLVEMLLTESSGLPIDQDVVKQLAEIKEKHTKSLEERDHIYKIIAQNSVEMTALRTEKQKKAANDASFDQSLYDQLLTKFQGDDNDIRPKYSFAKEILEKSRLFLPSNPSDPLDSYLRQAEDWLRRSKKLFGKTNAPFSVLKSHLTTIYGKNRWCFNCEDKYKGDLNETDHKIFCFCRRLESGTMIACENCNEWYHCRCLKFGRGKSKKLENYICPICDYRLEIPREYNSPKIEELRAITEEGSFLELVPDELYLIRDIYVDAFEFQEFLKTELNWVDGQIVETDVKKLKFYLRKLEGPSVLLLNEYNQLRQLIHKLDPICETPPPIIESSSKTRKKRKPAAQTSTPTKGFTKATPVPVTALPVAATLDTSMDMSMITTQAQPLINKVDVVKPGVSELDSKSEIVEPIVKSDNPTDGTSQPQTQALIEKKSTQAPTQPEPAEPIAPSQPPQEPIQPVQQSPTPQPVQLSPAVQQKAPESLTNEDPGDATSEAQNQEEQSAIETVEGSHGMWEPSHQGLKE